MDVYGKQWIKENWYRPILHVFPCVVFMAVCLTILNIWVAGLDNDASNTWNIFVTVAVFGALCWLTLVMLYLDKWSDRFEIYKQEYTDYIKQKENA